MNIEFSDQHKIAYDPKDPSVLSSFAYAYNNRTKVFSQLSVCITGTPEFIKNKLRKMLAEMEAEAGKPAQGQVITTTGDLCEVITNVWNGIMVNSDNIDKCGDKVEVEAELAVPAANDVAFGAQLGVIGGEMIPGGHIEQPLAAVADEGHMLVNIAGREYAIPTEEIEEIELPEVIPANAIVIDELGEPVNGMQGVQDNV